MKTNIDISNIQKSANDFSFIEEIFNAINNKDFCKNSQ
jgi:hypothetical protein